MSGAYDASSKTIVVYRDPGDSITVPITSINSAPAYDTEAHGQWLALIINPERFGCTVQLTSREVIHCLSIARSACPRRVATDMSHSKLARRAISALSSTGTCCRRLWLGKASGRVRGPAVPVA